MKPIDIMLDDLGQQIAEKSLAAAEWKARALSAEDTLAKMHKAAVQEEEQDEALALSIVDELDPEKEDE